MKHSASLLLVVSLTIFLSWTIARFTNCLSEDYICVNFRIGSSN